MKSNLFKVLLASVVITAVLLVPLAIVLYWLAASSMFSADDATGTTAQFYIRSAAVILLVMALMIVVGAWAYQKGRPWGRVLLMAGCALMVLSSLIAVVQLLLLNAFGTLHGMLALLWLVFIIPYVYTVVTIWRQHKAI